MTQIGDLSEIPKEVVFEWEIRDFLSLPDLANKRYESDKFYFSGASWILQIFPNGSTKEELGWISLFLLRCSSGFPITLNCLFSIKDIEGNEKQEREFINCFEKEYIRIGFLKHVERANLIKNKCQLLPKSNLTIVCTLKNSEPNAVSNSVFRRQQDICDNLREIFSSKRKTDLELKFNDGGSIHVHRAVLETRSPVFAAMFNHDTKEKQTGVVAIKDVNKTIMKILLEYLYSGDMSTPTTENALPLYAAAEKYDIEYVRVVCRHFIIHNLSVDWVTDVIAFAELYSLEEVSRCAREYFKEKAGEILKSDKWKNFTKENQDLGMELLSSLVQSLLPTTKKS